MKNKKIKVLNLYSGLGGNRKNWENVEVTSVEIGEKIAKVYSDNFPNDKLIIADAHEFLLNHGNEYNFIWSSPPCQSHTRMIRSGKNRKLRYPDLKLYEEIMFLMNDYKGGWIVENVVPYYEPLIKPTAKMGRHLVWSNFKISDFDVPTPKNFINKTNVKGSEELKEWLGIHYEGNLYYGKNHCPAQVLRNCVHPLTGEHIFNEYLKTL